jgi:starch synthase (maltosyl-transferring)
MMPDLQELSREIIDRRRPGIDPSAPGRRPVRRPAAVIDDTMIYYLHPLLAGPPDRWARHFARCARMGFRQVLLAPPFMPGRTGDIFLTADHRRLHPRLGNADAVETLADAADCAREHGLGLMVDLVIDRVAAESPLAASGAYRAAAGAGGPPDPRDPPLYAGAARLDAERAHDMVDCWQGRLAELLDAGIRGFRCEAPDRVPSGLWTALIAAARRRRPGAEFIAWTPGISADAARALVPCGFDLASSSSWAWDLRADWLDDETRRLSAIGDLLTMPELPFGARLAATSRNPEIACRRALMLAATYGRAWLLPMGFEFGARARLDRSHGRPEDFAALSEHPPFDLSPAVTEANRRHRGLAPARDGQVVSAPDARMAAFQRLRTARPGGDLVVVNTSLDRPAKVDLAPLLPELEFVPEPEAVDILAPGEVRVVKLAPAPPVRLPEISVDAATPAPRLAIETVEPKVDNGRFPAKLLVGQPVRVTADIICDGHDAIGAALLWRPADETDWREVALRPLGNDRWTAEFPLIRLGRHEFTLAAWIDLFATFREELAKKYAAGLPLDLELREGCDLVARIAGESGRAEVAELAARLDEAEPAARRDLLLAPETVRALTIPEARAFVVRHEPVLTVDAERRAAAFASWYEIFPRSQSPVPGRHGTFDDVIEHLPAIRDMGFDVLYFPPIHPIGAKNRKGRNNALSAGADDPGSPYAIGSAAGGHDAVHPALGTLEDFRRLRDAAAGHGLELALDFAIQCSPDHPWLGEHPDWFNWRPDGSIRYAENPPKKYEDIVNVAFYADAARPALWMALRDIVRFWVDQGIRIFRVDNPHTKPLPFWEWLIGDIRARDPGVIFLAEAFTRPKMMYRLAKLGFSQSYTYFTWRNSAWEMKQYLTELTTTAPAAFFRPHFFVNTPDINPLFLHHSGRPGFLIRAALAATLSGLWGVYNGFELCEAAAPGGREEYQDSEKYQLRHWDRDRPGNIVAEIRQLNRIRRANPALHSHLGLTFLACSNDAMLCYVKATASRDNVLLIAVSFDPSTVQEADFEISPEALGMDLPGELSVRDLVGGGAETWHTGSRHLRLDPAVLPFAIWRLRPAAEG